MASGANTNGGTAAGVSGGTHTGDLPDVRDVDHPDQAAAVERTKGLADFERLESAFIDRVYGGNRRAYEADYPLPE